MKPTTLNTSQHCTRVRHGFAISLLLLCATGVASAAGTTPDPKSLEVAAFVLLELDESAPPGCRTEWMRADAGKVRQWLESLYCRGETPAELLPDGSLRFPGFLDE